MPLTVTWDVSQIIIDIFSQIINVCVFNQSYGHWLFFDAFACKNYDNFETNFCF
jgi:hypothetical protein